VPVKILQDKYRLDAHGGNVGDGLLITIELPVLPSPAVVQPAAEKITVS